MMRRRYDAYRDVIVRPFFRDHFARLDRQIVLVDALSAFNAGPDAVRDLQGALVSILDCFRVGRGNVFNALFRPRVDRILFAATKADHLHHTAHDRLEAILKRMTARAIERAGFAGAEVDVIALAAVRATREGMVAATAAICRPSSASRRPAKPPAARSSTARPRSRSSPAICRPTSALFESDAELFRGLTGAAPARHRLPFRAVPAAAAGDDRRRACRPCLTSASTALCNS